MDSYPSEGTEYINPQNPNERWIIEEDGIWQIKSTNQILKIGPNPEIAEKIKVFTGNKI